MIKKVYSLGKEGRETIKNTSQQVIDIIGKTLGPAGRNYFLPTGITNDGRTIMEQVRFEDECQDQVSLAFHEIARQQDRDAGDGTTTAMVIGSQLVLDLIDEIPNIEVPVAGQKSTMTLLNELETEKDKALELLKKKKINIKSLKELEKVAFTALENEQGAKLVAETMWKSGKDSYPCIDYGWNGKIEANVIDGTKYPLKLANNKVFNKTGRVEYPNATVLVVNHCFEQYIEIAPFMISMLQEKKPRTSLVIVAKQFSTPFIQGVSEAIERSKFPIILVSQNFHQDTFDDIASYVDAQCIDTHPRTGKKIGEVKITDAGSCKKFIARDEETQFIGGRGADAIVLNDKGSINRIGQRISQIEELIKTEKKEDERKQMERRIASLRGGIITVLVDAKTTAERYYLKLKTEDAMNSCREALRHGIVKGGGLALKEVSDALGESSVLYNALRTPYTKIIMNNMGQEIDMTDIFDAYTVAKAGIENAVSVVKVIISIEGVIANKEHSMVESLQKVNEN